MDEINFGEKSVITLADRNLSVDATTGGTDFQHVNAYVSSIIISDTNTAGYEDVQITEDLVVGGSITGSLVDGVYVNIDQEITSKTQINKRKFDAVSTTAGDCEGDIVYFGATASSHVAGNIYTLNDAANPQWVIADANAAATSIGLLAVAMGEAASEGMCIRGMVSLAVTHAGSPVNNSVLFLDSVTAGGVNATRPSGSGDIIRVVGYKIGNGKRMWFNPASTFTEV